MNVVVNIFVLAVVDMLSGQAAKPCKITVVDEKNGRPVPTVQFQTTDDLAFTIEIKRRDITKRLGRLTGAGLLAESQKVGKFFEWKETGVADSDTVQTEACHGKLFWIWGDTNIFNYPLGIFSTPSATTTTNPLISMKPSTAIAHDGAFMPA